MMRKVRNEDAAMGPYYDIAVQRHRDDLADAERRRTLHRLPPPPRPWPAVAVAAVLACAVLL